MLSQRIKSFLTPFCEATTSFLLVRIHRNIWLAIIGQLQRAVETRFIVGVGALILSPFTQRWFDNKYVAVGITASMYFIADLLAHPSHYL